ncbi:ribonuclease III [Sphaerospermopsis aphanizomenoides BCCUSP55]|nr:ribonuclease III [Sphaerospermopsis aphanizomenoides BCCUSP55]
MAISNHERINRALATLSQGLYSYVEKEMRTVHGERWLSVAKSCISDDLTLRRNLEETLQEDVSVLLKLIIKQWDNFFKKKLSNAERALISELIDVRNKWAHQSRFSTDDTYRALDSMTRIMKVISASELDIIEKQKQEVLKMLSPEKAEEARIKEKLSEVHKLLIFSNEKLLRQALTHRSYLNENPGEGEHNERLEFLGDAILNFISGQYLYRCHPEKGEDELTRRRSALVEEKQLAKFALEVGLDFRMRLGKGTIRDGGFQNPNLLSSTFEAVVGAYYLDNNCNVEPLRAIIEPLFESVSEHIVEPRSNVDSKNRFQEWVQREIGTNPPKYVTEQVGGPSHAPEFIAKVLVEGNEYGEGKGRNKKEAEKAAAEDALAKLKKQGLLA